ncbi:glycosyltransferase [Nonlabens antarcticus]|uniref:glycosyltransferase n=1 Tax=Nonlabens antarcticus TaxID=392714 RepID=UPI001890F981|nr:glycosyltransferase [Nonlabens antarcticus]
METQVIVSVLMSIYDEPIEWINCSISSILNQSFLNFEFVIINDNPSRNENIVLLNKFKGKDSRIKVISNVENLGLTKSLNIGLKIAKGKYLARMDADDISLPLRLEKQVQFLEKNLEYILCGSSRIDLIEGKENLVTLPITDENIKLEMLLRNCITHPTVMLRNDILKSKNIHYDEHVKKSQDYALWVRMSSLGKFYNISEPLIHYRISNNQISKKNYNEQYKFSNGNRLMYINQFMISYGIDISGKNNFNKINVLKVNKRQKEIMQSAIMISKNKISTFSLLKFILRFNFVRYLSVHKYLLHYLLHISRNA